MVSRHWIYSPRKDPVFAQNDHKELLVIQYKNKSRNVLGGYQAVVTPVKEPRKYRKVCVQMASQLVGFFGGIAWFDRKSGESLQIRAIIPRAKIFRLLSLWEKYSRDNEKVRLTHDFYADPELTENEEELLGTELLSFKEVGGQLLLVPNEPNREETIYWEEDDGVIYYSDTQTQKDWEFDEFRTKYEPQIIRGGVKVY